MGSECYIARLDPSMAPAWHVAAKLSLPNGYEWGLDKMIEDFIKDGVVFVGIVGKDCAKVEDIIDELVVGDCSRDYDLLTSRHPGKSVEEAIAFAAALTRNFAGEVQVVQL